MNNYPQFTGCSYYSHLGASSVEQVVSFFKKNKFQYATLTEYGNANSAVEFYQKCKKNGLKPILGVQLILKNQWSRVRYQKSGRKFSEIDQDGLITVHFLDSKAYYNFCKLTPQLLVNTAQRYGEQLAVITLDQLKALGNISVGTSGLEGLFGVLYMNQDWNAMHKAMQDLSKNFKNLFIEICPLSSTKTWFGPMTVRGGTILIRQGRFFKNEDSGFAPGGDYQLGFNKHMLTYSKMLNLPAVPSYSFHFIEEGQKVAQDAKLSNDGLALYKLPNSHHVRSDEEVKSLLLAMGHDIADIELMFSNLNKWQSLFQDFSITTSKDRWVLPVFEGDSKEWVLREIQKRGRMKWGNPEWVDRLELEIKTLKYNGKLDVLPYFKPIVDLCDWCRDRGILFNLRGSASGSLLVYLIGISGLNPLDYDLSFERFINEGRIKANTLPDVDLDIGARDEVIAYLKSIYGENIVQLSVDVLSKIKTAIRDVERFKFGTVRPETESLVTSIPAAPQGIEDYKYVFGYTDDDGNDQPGIIDSNDSLKKYSEENLEVWDSVVKMLGLIRNKGTHACAFVITDKPVHEYIPLTKVKDRIVSGFSPKSLEDSGLVKYDFLGVNTLNDIALCIKKIKERHGAEIDIHNLPDDSDVYQQFWKGHCETVFQYNTATVIPYLKKTKPNSIDELANITALCRPGTLDAPNGDGRTLAQVYVSRVQGEPIEYVHPDMEPILRNTFGVQLFQELQIKIFRDLAGYSTEEAESVRRGIGKKDEKVLNEAVGRLKKACVNRGWTETQVLLLADQIKAAARYSFNKSHAVSYAKIGYACQYLKTKFPLEWWSSVLSNASKEEVPKFWDFCSSFVSLPDINKSGFGWEIEQSKVRAPISILSGMGESGYQVILDTKPYVNIDDFIIKVKSHPKSRSINKGVVFKIIASGMADGLFQEGTSLQEKIEQYLIAKARFEKKKKIEDFPEEYKDFNNPITKYKTIKELISIWSRDLREIVLPNFGCEKPINGDVWYFQGRSFIQLDGLDALCNKFNLIYKKASQIDPESARYNIKKFVSEISPSSMAYVIDEKTKTYHNKTKQFTQLLIDVGGSFRYVIVWPPYEGNIAPTGFKNEIVDIEWSFNSKRGEMGIGSILIPKLIELKYNSVEVI